MIALEIKRAQRTSGIQPENICCSHVHIEVEIK